MSTRDQHGHYARQETVAEGYTSKDIVALGLVVARLVERLDEVRAERDAVMAALVQEYADVLEGRGPWAEQGPEAGHPSAYAMRRAVAAVPLLRVAERLGESDLHERAAALLAGQDEDHAREH